MIHLQTKIIENKEQLQDAYEVRRQVFIEEQQIPPEDERDEYDHIATHIVIYDGKKPVATGRFRIVAEGAKLERAAVLSTYRGKGLGKKIIQTLEKVAHSQGIKKAIMYAQQHAQEFYEQLGYSVTSEPFTIHNILHVKMEKHLHKKNTNEK
jgi:predicted GNAT family N-acyltransferase